MSGCGFCEVDGCGHGVSLPLQMVTLYMCMCVCVCVCVARVLPNMFHSTPNSRR